MVQSFFDFWSSQHTDLPIPSPSKIRGGTFIITGGNHGLGLQAAKHLVRLTAARVIISSRSIPAGEAAIAEIDRDTGKRGVVEVWQLDLSDFDSVRRFAAKANELDRLDAVVENASIALDHWSVNKDGMETTVAVNIVGTFLLGLLVFPKLVESGRKFGTTPHLTVMGSGAGFFCAGLLEKIDGDIIKAYNTKTAYPGMNHRYDSSKLLQLYVFRELAALLPYDQTGVVINYVDPGVCNTGLARNASLKTRMTVRTVNLLLGRTPEMGSRTLLHGATAGPESHGKYCNSCAVQEQHVPDWVTNKSGSDIQQRLWKEVSGILNDIEPGCVSRAASKAR